MQLGKKQLLSYRHSYHAGNFADVIKHIVLIEMLEHLVKKEGVFDYIDTHAGAGLYNLRGEHAVKLKEYSQGIGRLSVDVFPELSRYFAILKSYNPRGGLNYYPGSPVIAMNFLRAKDRAWLFEMHPKDFILAEKNAAINRNVRVSCEDGFKGLLALLPPVSRRGLVLIDPSYEIKTDYSLVFDTILSAHKKFSSGMYALWYPVVERKSIENLERKFINSGIKNIQQFELAMTADSLEKGMTGAGMIVINPPWTLMSKMLQVLPKLVEALKVSEQAFCKSNVLVAE